MFFDVLNKCRDYICLACCRLSSTWELKCLRHIFYWFDISDRFVGVTENCCQMSIMGHTHARTHTHTHALGWDWSQRCKVCFPVFTKTQLVSQHDWVLKTVCESLSVCAFFFVCVCLYLITRTTKTCTLCLNVFVCVHACVCVFVCVCAGNEQVGGGGLQGGSEVQALKAVCK